MQEATRMFWRQTVLPLVARTTKALSGWLAPAYGSPIELRADLDGIEALSTEREALWTRIDKANFLTPNEKRAAAGYGPLDDGDIIGKANFSPGQLRDDLGRWTDEGGSDRPHPVQGRRLFGGLRRPVQIPPGTTIRNKDLAGKKHPDTGIPFDSQRFPDFSSVASHTVRVPHTGTPSDFTAANRAAGFASTPPDMTWHHHQDGHTMQLVPSDIHRRTGHTGSRGIGNTPGKR